MSMTTKSSAWSGTSRSTNPGSSSALSPRSALPPRGKGFGAVDLLALSPVLRPGTSIGGPLTQGMFTFNPELPAYNILNARIGFLDGRWDVAVFVDNVTDARALLALDQERGTLARVGYLTNPPRSIGISTRIDF